MSAQEKCRNCQADFPSDGSFCPFCGFPHQVKCSKCGTLTTDDKISVESWTLENSPSGKQIYQVRKMAVAPYCFECHSGLFLKRSLASCINALPLWFFAGRMVDSGLALFFFVVYGNYLWKNFRYAWADDMIYGAELSINLERQVFSIKNLNSTITFPIEGLLTKARWLLYLGGIFFFVSGALILQEPKKKTDVPLPVARVQTAQERQEISSEALFQAVEKGSLMKVRSILDKNRSLLGSKDKNGLGLLHRAAFADSTVIINELYRRGLNPDLPDPNGFTALHWAAIWGKPRAAEGLIHCGAKVESRAKNGLTPLHFAVSYRQRTVCVVLLEKGADPFTKTNDGEDAFALANAKKFPDIAVLLATFKKN